LAGANLIYGLGMLESGVTFDYGQLVMDCEFARMIKHCVAGIRVDDESLMVDEVHAVGSSGDFLSRDSTLRHMREQSQPRLMDRRVREDWRQAGSTDLLQRATAEAVRILDQHVPEPLPADVAAALRAIVADAERELGGG
jgi:trimethylamine--corrinoid protein Co-methyltransferase